MRGDIDVLPASLTPGTLNAIVRGARVRVVASHAEYTAGTCAQSGILVQQALLASGKLSTRDGLKGLRIAGTRSPATNYVIDKFLGTFGLSTDDLTRIDVPEEFEGEALRTGRLDLATMGEPALTHALAAGHGVVWRAINDLAPGFQYGMLPYGPRLLDREPDLGHRFMAAYLEANRRCAQGKTARNLDVVSMATGRPRDLASRVCWPSTRLDATVNPGPLADFQAWSLAHGLIDKALPFASLVDTRFTDAFRAGPGR